MLHSCSTVIGQHSLVVGQHSLVVGQHSLVEGQHSLVVGQHSCSTVIGPSTITAAKHPVYHLPCTKNVTAHDTMAPLLQLMWGVPHQSSRLT